MNRKPCNCPKCLSSTRQDDNVERARAAVVAVICIKCGNAADSAVGLVLAMHGRVRCGSCDRRKR